MAIFNEFAKKVPKFPSWVLTNGNFMFILNTEYTLKEVCLLVLLKGGDAMARARKGDRATGSKQ